MDRGGEGGSTKLDYAPRERNGEEVNAEMRREVQSSFARTSAEQSTRRLTLLFLQRLACRLLARFVFFSLSITDHNRLPFATYLLK